jgi:hypothetical protein
MDIDRHARYLSLRSTFLAPRFGALLQAKGGDAREDGNEAPWLATARSRSKYAARPGSLYVRTLLLVAHLCGLLHGSVGTGRRGPMICFVAFTRMRHEARAPAVESERPLSARSGPTTFTTLLPVVGLQDLLRARGVHPSSPPVAYLCRRAPDAKPRNERSVGGSASAGRPTLSAKQGNEARQAI